MIPKQSAFRMDQGAVPHLWNSLQPQFWESSGFLPPPPGAEPFSSAESEALNEVLATSDRVIGFGGRGQRDRRDLDSPSRYSGKNEPDLVQWSNHLRIHTRVEVVRAELLLRHEGDLFDAQLVEENELHLIGAGFASVVVIVPLKTEREDTVDLLVVTRDLWSLRLSSDFETAGSVINYVTQSHRYQLARLQVI